MDVPVFWERGKRKRRPLTRSPLRGGKLIGRSGRKMIQFAEQVVHARLQSRPQLLLLDRIALDQMVHRHFKTTDFDHQVMPQVHRCEFVTVVHDTSPSLACTGVLQQACQRVMQITLHFCLKSRCDLLCQQLPFTGINLRFSHPMFTRTE
jgi:hypothetical protein